MKMNNTKFVLLGILLIAVGFVFGYIRNKRTSETKVVLEKSYLNFPSHNSLQSSFFTELKKNMQHYQDGSQILIKPISFKNKIAVLEYATSQETSGYIVIDFGNNKMYQTKFYASIGGIFSPILVGDANNLIALSTDEGTGNTALDLTDLEGNVLKTLKKFISSNLQENFSYGSILGKNIITIFDQRYTLDQNYDLVPVKE